MFPNMGLPEIILLILLALILFGPAKLPEIGKAMGKGINEFKAAMKGEPEQPAEKQAERR